MGIELKNRIQKMNIMLQEVDLYKEELEDNYCAYLFGSRTYNTHTIDSDYDFVIILNEEKNHPDELKSTEINLKIYTPKEYQSELDNHEISALEVYFLYEEQLVKKGFIISIDKQKLRKSISSIVSNSWVKAKKKITVENEVYIGIKSLFHSIRITEYGRQIAEKGIIYDFYIMNNIWNEILKDKDESWEELAEKYKPIYNAKLTEFRKLAPKKI